MMNRPWLWLGRILLVLVLLAILWFVILELGLVFSDTGGSNSP